MCWAIGEHGGGGAPHKDAARELFEGLELLLYENLSSRYGLLLLLFCMDFIIIVLFLSVLVYFLVPMALHPLTFIFALVFSWSRLGLRQESTLGSTSQVFRRSSQSRLLCFVITAIAKLATYHRELLPRARVSLGKVWSLVLPYLLKILFKFNSIFQKSFDKPVLIKLLCICQVARSRISDVRVWRRARDYLGLMNEPAISLSVLGPSRPSPGQGQNPGTVKWSDGATKMIAHIPFYILGEQEGIDPFLWTPRYLNKYQAMKYKQPLFLINVSTLPQVHLPMIFRFRMFFREDKRSSSCVASV